MALLHIVAASIVFSMATPTMFNGHSMSRDFERPALLLSLAAAAVAPRPLTPSQSLAAQPQASQQQHPMPAAPLRTSVKASVGQPTMQPTFKTMFSGGSFQGFNTPPPKANAS